MYIGDIDVRLEAAFVDLRPSIFVTSAVRSVRNSANVMESNLYFVPSLV
jgi:hypothetical protein